MVLEKVDRVKQSQVMAFSNKWQLKSLLSSLEGYSGRPTQLTDFDNSIVLTKIFVMSKMDVINFV